MSESRAKGQEAQDGLTYEQARDELTQTVALLESGEVPLSQALKLWERGEQLADICDKWLAGALERLEPVKDGEGS
ncbi:MAG: exodeoxyribonuclease VII small subunit [Propionibacteriaceae bacterium]|jgi:exodeoxyribonuclease VII small subunit|nr:exodeoxyribonuclease VII small subunit [Propionibacteriaceae bacterium]